MPSCPVCHVAFLQDSKCVTCSKCITCSKCSATLHLNCTKIPLDQVESLTSGATPYICHICVDAVQELRTALAQMANQQKEQERRLAEQAATIEQLLKQMTTKLTSLNGKQKEQERRLAVVEERPLESVRFVPPEPIIITLNTLPVVLLELLFSYLCLSDRLQMSMVSKKLYNVFWRSPVGANLWKGLTFRIERINQIQNLVNSRIFQMNDGAINRLVLDIKVQDWFPVMNPLTWAKWDLLAPKLTSLTINHDAPLDIFRLLRSCSRLVTLNWRNCWCAVDPLDRPDGYSKEDPDAVCLPELRHLDLSDSMTTPFLDTFLSIITTKSRLATLKLKHCGPLTNVIAIDVPRHAASLKNLCIPASDISAEELVALGSIPDLRLLELDISFCMNIDLESFVQFLRLQPNLVSLDISGCEDIFGPDGRWDTLMNEFISLISGLKSFHAICSHKSWKKFTQLIPFLTHLQKLRFPTADSETNWSLKKSSCTLLSATLHFETILSLHDDQLRNLREVKVSGSKVFDGMFVARIWQHCPNLEALDMSECDYFVNVHTPVRYNNLRKLTDLNLKLNASDGWTDSLAMQMKLPNLRRLLVNLSMDSRDSKNFLEFNRHLSSGTPFLEYVGFTNLSHEVIFDMFPGQFAITEFRKLWPRLKDSSLKPTEPRYIRHGTSPWIYPGRPSINDS